MSTQPNKEKATSKAAPAADMPVFKKQRSNAISLIAPVVCVLLGYVIWRYYLGNPAGFTNPDPEGGFWPHHMGAKGIHGMYEGGIIVPVLISLFLIVLTFVIERFITISRAQGKGDTETFIRKVQLYLSRNDMDAAFKACDAQGGSVGNVMRAGLVKYKQMAEDKTGLTHEQKVGAIQAEVDDSTALELPILEKNLVFLSTIASVATLVGLLGTVLGMIRAFASLGEEGGAGAASQLAVGIAEALYNTALGIGTSAFAIILYNIFTTKIDAITYGIDESGFTLVQSFTLQNKK